MITSCINPGQTYNVIAREIILSTLTDVINRADGISSNTAIVLAPIVPGSLYPALDPQWTTTWLTKSTDVPWWIMDAPLGSDVATIMQHADPRTNQTVARIGVNWFVGTVPFSECEKVWTFGLFSLSFDGTPIIIHDTTTPLLVDFTK